jgi:uncharacterized protein
MKTTTTMNFPTTSSMVSHWLLAVSRWLLQPNSQQPVVNGQRLTANSRWLTAVLLLITMGVSAQSDAALFPPKPEPAVYVHDYAGWLSASQRNALEIKLRRYWDSTSTQVVVMIRPDLGDYDKTTYAIELGNRWGIGRKDKNNGVLMLIKSEPPDRGIFIATGYGTEGALPDITAGRIIRNTMAPYFRQQQYYEGINAGTDDIIRALQGEFKNDDKGAKENGDGAIAALVVLLVFVVFFFVLYRMAKRRGTLYTHSGRGLSRRSRGPFDDGGWWWIGGGGFGGGGGGGGGWNDGGGFGGGDFGGGSFGGGGAGGDW